MKKLFCVFTDPETEKEHKAIRSFWLVFLLLIILAGWGFFLNFLDFSIGYPRFFLGGNLEKKRERTCVKSC